MNNKRTHILLSNCREKKECLICGRCNSENVVSQAEIFSMERRNDEKVYTGISAVN